MHLTQKKLSIFGFAAAAILFLLAGVMAASGKDYQALSLDEVWPWPGRKTRP